MPRVDREAEVVTQSVGDEMPDEGRPVPDSASPAEDADEAVYGLDELKRFARLAFGVESWDVEGAMHLAGRTSGTRAEVRKALSAYLTREV